MWEVNRLYFCFGVKSVKMNKHSLAQQGGRGQAIYLMTSNPSISLPWKFLLGWPTTMIVVACCCCYSCGRWWRCWCSTWCCNSCCRRHCGYFCYNSNCCGCCYKRRLAAGIAFYWWHQRLWSDGGTERSCRRFGRLRKKLRRSLDPGRLGRKRRRRRPGLDPATSCIIITILT